MDTTHPGPTLLVIFGAAGDLTWRKLVPAVYNLFLDEWLPEQFLIIGVDRKEMDEGKFCQHLKDGVDRFSRRGKTDSKTWDSFSTHICSYISADFKQDVTYTRLAEELRSREEAWGAAANRVFYMATPPAMVSVV
ncbi:MAG: glucose-6-phosphate dehydrogenase, partial [Anaerolineales bacterium]